jgi:HSF-type DNA-binding
MKRTFDHTNNLPLEIRVEQEDTRDNGGSKNTCKEETKNNSGQRDPTRTFPCILHEILSNPAYNECITWQPNGQAWRIIRRTQFERVVIPRYFRHGRYSSFMRQVRISKFVNDQCFHLTRIETSLFYTSSNLSLFFLYQVNGWGFQRITAGPNHHAYHHEVRFSL